MRTEQSPTAVRLRDAQSLLIFRRDLKTFLFRSSFDRQLTLTVTVSVIVGVTELSNLIRCYIFMDRLFVLSPTMAVLSMVLSENLTYVYMIRYRTMHCNYASVPSEPHLPRVCVFKPMNLHSTYYEECWAYSILSGLAYCRAIRLTIRSSDQNSKLPSFQNLISSKHGASALHRNLKRLVLSGILYLSYLSPLWWNSYTFLDPRSRWDPWGR